MKQFNKVKTPIVFRVGVILLCAMLFSSYLMGGLYARYSTAVTGSTAVQVAKIDVDVVGNFFGHTLTNVDFDNNDVYAIIQDFTVVNAGEVSYKYDLKLRLSKDASDTNFDNPILPEQFNFDAPNATVTSYLYEGENKNAGLSVTPGYAHYAYSPDGTNYTWYQTAVADKEEISIRPPSASLVPDGVHYYRTVYFVTMNTGLSNGALINSPQMILFYSITCEQVD